jgi:hypothetical protein
MPRACCSAATAHSFAWFLVPAHHLLPRLFSSSDHGHISALLMRGCALPRWRLPLSRFRLLDGAVLHAYTAAVLRLLFCHFRTQICITRLRCLMVFRVCAAPRICCSDIGRSLTLSADISASIVSAFDLACVLRLLHMLTVPSAGCWFCGLYCIT